MNAPRLPWATLAADQYKSLYGVNQALARSALGNNLLELVQTRVSQINGCAFCLDMHVRELRRRKVMADRLSGQSSPQTHRAQRRRRARAGNRGSV
jgi:AhpD family alkylhydroperoxidase